MSSAWNHATAEPTRPLPQRIHFESAFGADFSSVRVWLGERDRLRPVAAEAATSGEEIVFASSNPSRRVIAHELAHVLQYRFLRTRVRAGLSRPGEPAERAAEQAARRALAGEAVDLAATPMAEIMRQAIGTAEGERVTFAELRRDHPDIAELYDRLSDQYVVVQEHIFPLLVSTQISMRAPAADLTIGNAHRDLSSHARLMAEEGRYTARLLAHWTTAIDDATGWALREGLELVERTNPDDSEIRDVLSVARAHVSQMRESIDLLKRKPFIQRGRVEGKGGVHLIRSEDGRSVEVFHASKEPPRPPADPVWSREHENSVRNLWSWVQVKRHDRVARLVESVPPGLRREMATRFEDRYGVALLVYVRDNCPIEVLNEVKILMDGHLSLGQELLAHVYEGALYNSATDEAILNILGNDPGAIADLYTSERDELVDELSMAMSHAGFFEAHKLLRPDDPVRVVKEFVHAADGFWWNDKQGVYDALLELEPAQRTRFWRDADNQLVLWKYDAANIELIEEMCTGTESRALEIRAILATRGAGTSEAGLEAVAARTKAAIARKQKLAELIKTLEAREQEGTPEAEERELLDELRDELPRLNVKESGILDLNLDESGKVDVETLLGRIRADVDRFEFQRLAKAMGVDATALAKQQIRDASGRLWDVKQEMYDAIARLPKAESDALLATLGSAGEADRSDAEDFVARALAGLSAEERAIARDYAGDDPFRIAIRKLRAEPPYKETLLILAQLSHDERQVRMTEVEFLDVYHKLALRNDPLIDAVMTMDERFPSERVLAYALDGFWAGPNEELVFLALERLPDDTRKLYRDGYWLHRSGRRTSETPEGERALAAFSRLNERLSAELGAAAMQTAYDRLLGVPPASVLAGKQGIEETELAEDPRRAADVLHFRVIDRFGTRGGLAEAFTSADEALAQAAVEFETRYREAIADNEVTLDELSVLAHLEQDFSRAYGSYLSSTQTVSEYAAMITALAAGVAITAATGGLAGPAVGATWATLGLALPAGAATQLATKEIFLGERFDLADDEGVHEALKGAVDGALSVATAGLGGRIRAALFAGGKLGSVKQGAAVLELGEQALKSAPLTQAGREAGQTALERIRTDALESAIEESLSSAAAELVMTAVDKKTYDQTMWQVLTAFGRTALRGGLTGALTGGALGGSLATGAAGLQRLGRELGVSGPLEPADLRAALDATPGTEQLDLELPQGENLVAPTRKPVERRPMEEIEARSTRLAPKAPATSKIVVERRQDMGRTEGAVVVERDSAGRPIGFKVEAGPDIRAGDLAIHVEIAQELQDRYTGFVGKIRMLLEDLRAGLTGRLAPYREGVLELEQDLIKIGRLMDRRIARIESEALSVEELRDIRADMQLFQHHANRIEEALRDPSKLAEFPKGRFLQPDRPDPSYPHAPRDHRYVWVGTHWDLVPQHGNVDPVYRIRVVNGQRTAVELDPDAGTSAARLTALSEPQGNLGSDPFSPEPVTPQQRLPKKTPVADEPRTATTARQSSPSPTPQRQRAPEAAPADAPGPKPVKERTLSPNDEIVRDIFAPTQPKQDLILRPPESKQSSKPRTESAQRTSVQSEPVSDVVEPVRTATMESPQATSPTRRLSREELRSVRANVLERARRYRLEQGEINTGWYHEIFASRPGGTKPGSQRQIQLGDLYERAKVDLDARAPQLLDVEKRELLDLARQAGLAGDTQFVKLRKSSPKTLSNRASILDREKWHDELRRRLRGRVVNQRLRDMNEARVALEHRLTAGQMQEARLQSEHLLPQSVLERDPEAIVHDLVGSKSPTIMIDEDLHRAGLTYGQGLDAVWEMKNPLEMVDALISDYVRLLGTRRFSHLPKRKYVEGFQKLRQTYIDQYPSVFKTNRKAWDE